MIKIIGGILKKKKKTQWIHFFANMLSVSFSFIFSGHGYYLIFLVRISISNVSSQTPVFQWACHRSCPYYTHAELEFFSLVIYIVLLYVETWNELSDDYYSFEITRRHI